MRLTICAVGRLRSGPERDLLDDYLTRFDRTGRALGLGPAKVVEVEDKKGGGKPAEAALLLKSLPDRATVWGLDEHGKTQTSPQFAEAIAKTRDQGCQDLAFVIGGADGLGNDILARADRKLSFGPMVWTHMLVRVMIAEQLYRAASILSSSPYHRY